MKKIIYKIKDFLWKIKEFLMNIKLWILAKFYKKAFNNQPTLFYKKGYKNTLYEDFSNDNLNRDIWIDQAYYGLRFHPGNIVNNGIAPNEYYSEYNNVISNGTLKQYTYKENTTINYIDWDGKDWGTYTIPFTIGMLTTKTFRQQYGYFEIRAKMPNSTATWPAFWLCGSITWPPEIDIYEWHGGKSKKNFESTLHWGVDKTSTRGLSCWAHKLFNLTEDFHIYACEWTSKYVKIYFDGVCVRTFKDSKVLDWFNQPLIVILGNGVDDSEDLEKATFPNIHEVDYVKVYEKL